LDFRPFVIRHMAILIVLIAPGFFTHACTGIFAYLWVWFAFCVAYGVISSLFLRCFCGSLVQRHENGELSDEAFFNCILGETILGDFTNNMIYSIVGSYIAGSTIPWAIKLYDGENYIDVLTIDYNSRTWECYYNTMNENWHHKLIFLSSL